MQVSGNMVVVKEEEEDIYIGQGYRYALWDQDAFCLVIQDSLQGKSELQG